MEVHEHRGRILVLVGSSWFRPHRGISSKTATLFGILLSSFTMLENGQSLVAISLLESSPTRSSGIHKEPPCEIINGSAAWLSAAHDFMLFFASSREYA